jgi:hypothetical protein
MTQGPLAVILAAAVCALAQPVGQKMGASSTVVFGGVSDGKQGFNFVSRAGGFFIDSRHVVSNILDCCGKSDKGEQVTPIVYWGKDDAGAAKVIWSSEDTEIAILELDKPLNHPGVSIAPSKLVRQGEPVYSVQYPKPGDNGSAQLAEGKLTGTAAAGDKNVPLYKSNLQMNPNNAGGALFDACGNAIGINLTMKDGEQYAFVIDSLIGALQAAGVQAAVADQPCSASGGSGASGAGAGGGTQGGGDGGKQTKGKAKEGGEPGPRPQWRLPQGSEWIPVVIVLGLLALAFRPARKQVAQVVTGRHRLPESAPYPYPGAPPAPYAPTPYTPAPYGGTPGMAGMPAPPVPMAPPVATRPVLRGITGQYAGSAFSLEGGSTLGRDPAAANLVFGGEASSVSKRHCSVRWDAGRGLFLLEDHGSTNGTFLASGERLIPNQPRELRPGERFYIGDLRNQFGVTLES